MSTPPFEIITSVLTEFISTDRTAYQESGLEVPVTSGRQVHFVARLIYSAGPDAMDVPVGARFSISGPAAAHLAYTSRYTLSATSETVNCCDAYEQPAAANASSASVGFPTSIGAGNLAVIEGILLPFSTGTLKVIFASAGTDSAEIAIKNGSYLYTEQFTAGGIYPE